jgi:predicted dinucleotide-binding enzyme
MRIGILGSGLMGSKLGTIFARAGHEVIFSYSRSDAKLKKLAREAKANRAPVHYAKPYKTQMWPYLLCTGPV